jgi:alpha,alpha-trehalase
MVRLKFEKSLVVLTLLLSGFAGTIRYPSAQTLEQKPADKDNDIVEYIHSSWQTLKRSTNDCTSLSDPKLGRRQENIIYVPQNIVIPAALQTLPTQCKARIAKLPRRIVHMGDLMPDSLAQAGLLYLPYPYVVPGGRFNEMYGWDSYFIILGLVEDGEIDLARGMVENFFFEIENYGAILNANRTYYFTRSQPPFLTSMILAVYDAQKKQGRADQGWLAKAYTYAERDYRQWTTDRKLAGDTGLSRYFDLGRGPVPEIGDDPEYYSTVADWAFQHPETTRYIAKRAEGTGPEFHVPRCGAEPCKGSHEVRLIADYYKGDRAMRESGFDTSFRFGPFGGSTHHFAPVCLNSLLYKTEKDMEQMAHLLDRTQAASRWQKRAKHRKVLITRFLWNPNLGLFTDFDFYQHRASSYQYATAFYPLWAGLATKEQAAAVMKNLKSFEQPGGIAMSDRETGMQWDRPYAWAPIQLLAVEGMRRYGFGNDADRVTREFLTMVTENFARDGTIREKYNALKRSSEVNVVAGYAANVVGFGWTNGTFIVLLHELPVE